MGHGDEPVFDRLQILPKGQEFLESFSNFSKFSRFVNSNWTIAIFSGLVVAVLGYYLVEYLKNL
ncbi:hypothetical protein AALB_2240 [Agarivorans albus MKT 106]|uniref:Uncharacterized protein n=1 Tax=Agarivorans albus MKT 106 TaxID=1331007 RepID=R9PLE7_AGAAL|nr:hypothetical protein AALB_2240 [Agarivorans albus MKT 106]